jgi:hypothetical protein
MTDEAATQAGPAGAPDVNQGATGSFQGESPLSVGSEQDPFDERPELYVGAAFAGGFVAAMILRRLAR